MKICLSEDTSEFSSHPLFLRNAMHPQGAYVGRHFDSTASHPKGPSSLHSNVVSRCSARDTFLLLLTKRYLVALIRNSRKRKSYKAAKPLSNLIKKTPPTFDSFHSPFGSASLCSFVVSLTLGCHFFINPLRYKLLVL